mmetsp:Transcript_22123/g.64200  ORF Transcript_22123/g.64200 Transcript_22123/m.64200 type:complete len:236 (-) Transcript_22123:378-1085(-)
MASTRGASRCTRRRRWVDLLIADAPGVTASVLAPPAGLCSGPQSGWARATFGVIDASPTSFLFAVSPPSLDNLASRSSAALASSSRRLWMPPLKFFFFASPKTASSSSAIWLRRAADTGGGKFSRRAISAMTSNSAATTPEPPVDDAVLEGPTWAEFRPDGSVWSLASLAGAAAADPRTGMITTPSPGASDGNTSRSSDPLPGNCTTTVHPVSGSGLGRTSWMVPRNHWGSWSIE